MRPTICAPSISSPRRAGSPSPTATAMSPIPRSWTCRWRACCRPRISRSGASSCRRPAAWAPVGPGVPPGYVERGTSHISIVDRWGNAVTFTTTIEAPFGAHMMVRGFILNNELTDFSLRPELNGKPVANRVQPGKRPRSSMSPDLRPRPRPEAGGGAGLCRGARIIGDTLQALIGLLDWDLSAQAARRPAAGDQHERRNRTGGGDADRRPGGCLARAGP